MHIDSVRFIDIATRAELGEPYLSPPTHQFFVGDVVALRNKRSDELTMYSIVGRHLQQLDDDNMGGFGLIYKLRALPEVA